MDLASHQAADRFVHQTVTLDPASTPKTLGHHVNAEVPALAGAGMARMLGAVVLNGEGGGCETAL